MKHIYVTVARAVHYCYSIASKNRRKVKAEVRVNIANDLRRSASDRVSPPF